MKEKNLEEMRKDILHTAVELTKKIKQHRELTKDGDHKFPTNDALESARITADLVAMDVAGTEDPKESAKYVEGLLCQ